MAGYGQKRSDSVAVWRLELGVGLLGVGDTFRARPSEKRETVDATQPPLVRASRRLHRIPGEHFSNDEGEGGKPTLHDADELLGPALLPRENLIERPSKNVHETPPATLNRIHLGVLRGPLHCERLE